MVNHNIDRMAGLSGAIVAGHAVGNLATGNGAKSAVRAAKDSFAVMVVLALVPAFFGAIFYGLGVQAGLKFFAIAGGLAALIFEIVLFPVQVMVLWKVLVYLVKAPFKLLGFLLMLPKRIYDAQARRRLAKECDAGRAIISQVRALRK